MIHTREWLDKRDPIQRTFKEDELIKSLKIRNATELFSHNDLDEKDICK